MLGPRGAQSRRKGVVFRKLRSIDRGIFEEPLYPLFARMENKNGCCCSNAHFVVREAMAGSPRTIDVDMLQNAWLVTPPSFPCMIFE